ncbi:c-type cytochrome [Roseateles sp. BYS180W]|uniref:C-type cytochrome n=1 Tax=Roseateles rivi TaxID=3299028 RepID=A0ABW7FUA2_9BURK
MSHNQDHGHEGPIKTPKQLIWAVVFAFVVPVLVIILLANYVSNSPKPGAGTELTAEEAVAARIQPVGHVEIKAEGSAATLKTGEQVFQAQCAACHTTGAAGAPKLGDAAAWGPRLGQGFDLLVEHALKGKGAMAAQGGGEHSDFEIARAVVYLANQGGAKFSEPKAPAAASAASQ